MFRNANSGSENGKLSSKNRTRCAEAGIILRKNSYSVKIRRKRPENYRSNCQKVSEIFVTYSKDSAFCWNWHKNCYILKAYGKHALSRRKKECTDK